MQPDCELYNGVEMHVTRIRALEEAQSVRVFTGGNVERPRIRYGEESEDWGAGRGELCHDCGARAGQYHALGCDVERCPVCDEQALVCEHDLYGFQSEPATARSKPSPPSAEAEEDFSI